MSEPKPFAFLMASIVFGVPMFFVFWKISHNPASALGAAAVGGALFGIAMRGFSRAAEKSAFEMGGKAAEFEDGERLLHSGSANHFVKMESVGGKLFLTEKRLRFRSHKFNVQTHDTSFELASIASAEATRTLGVIPNGLRVTLGDGTAERFVVFGNRAWADAINQARSRPPA